MPPELFDVVQACPTSKVWKAKTRPAEPDLAGARDRALLLAGFVAALRRSELAALRVEDVEDHANGLVLTLPRSKTNQTGESTELVVLPRATNPDRCPVTALQRWMSLAGVVEGPVFRGVGKSNRAGTTALNPGSINALAPDRNHPGRDGPDPLLRC